jgi:hypothetical protein
MHIVMDALHSKEKVQSPINNTLYLMSFVISEITITQNNRHRFENSGNDFVIKYLLMPIVYKVCLSGRFKDAGNCHVALMIHLFVEWKTLELITLQYRLRTHTTMIQ